MENQKTVGELRVRTDFNVTGNKEVDLIKQKAAELINLIDSLKITEHQGQQFADASRLGEYIRLKALALTSAEESAMWAVKAATF